jgi:hypothetical protein
MEGKWMLPPPPQGIRRKRIIMGWQKLAGHSNSHQKTNEIETHGILDKCQISEWRREDGRIIMQYRAVGGIREGQKMPMEMEK